MLHVSPEVLALLRRAQAREQTMRERDAGVRLRRPSRQLGKKRFEALVEGTAIVLKTGKPTLFQFEGACRTGLRRALIENSWCWSDADQAAAGVVSAALRRIGAVRPTWYEGQREFPSNVAIDRNFCARCGTPLEEGRQQYCSKLCSNAAYKQRAAEFGTQVSLAEYQAALAEKRADRLKELSINCDCCGVHFLARKPGVRFCSRKCGSSERVKVLPRPCSTCGTVFTPSKGGAGKFCSAGCYHASLRSVSEGALPAPSTNFVCEELS